MPELHGNPGTQAWGLLRLLFIRVGEVPAQADRGSMLWLVPDACDHSWLVETLASRTTAEQGQPSVTDSGLSTGGKGECPNLGDCSEPIFG